MKKSVSIGLASLMTAQLVGTTAQAQFEDFPPPPPPPDFGNASDSDISPVPAPPSSGGTRGGAPSYGGSKGSSASGGPEVLDKKAKSKFAKASAEDIT
ncbi:MAG: type II secretion system protein GspD, partial [Bdellovibrio sp.]|nr:type II secretion system protein GspD [Bdellovibrio sp.]